MVQLAQAREHFGVEGTSAETAELFRDKSRMKDALRAAGLPVARNRLVHARRGRAGVRRGGRLPDGAEAARGHGREVDLPRGLARGRAAAARRRDGRRAPSDPVLAEEFLRGREFSFETITIGGEPRVQSISHYLPGCLEVVENPWIQWCCMLPRDISGPSTRARARWASRAIEALGLDDGMTHMEWFQRPDGSLAIGEIAQRPPGANITHHDRPRPRRRPRTARGRARSSTASFDGPWERKYAVGSAFLRGMGRGRVAGVTGVAKLQRPRPARRRGEAPDDRRARRTTATKATATSSCATRAPTS